MDLDPVEVTHHLNALGYEDIEPHLLQKFMKDLKKLIKYEKQKSRDNEKENVFLDLNPKSKSLSKENKVILQNNHCKNACCNKKNNDVFERLSRPSTKSKLCSKAVSSVAVQTDAIQKKARDNKYSQVLRRKKMDPVSLYKYYQNSWQTHNVTGQKNHDQLRWQVRQMMIHK